MHLGSLQEVACTWLWIFNQICNSWWKIPEMPEEYTFFIINPIPGNPGPISRESGNCKIVGIPGNWEQEIPGMKLYLAPHVRSRRGWKNAGGASDGWSKLLDYILSKCIVWNVVLGILYIELYVCVFLECNWVRTWRLRTVKDGKEKRKREMGEGG
jgi:hypothetical protein